MNDRKYVHLGYKPSSFRRAIRLVRRICQVAAAHSLIDDSRVGLARHGVIAAVRRHDTPVIFDWLLDLVSYQGVSDSIAYSYMEQHGRVRWRDIAGGLGEIAELLEADVLLVVREVRL